MPSGGADISNAKNGAGKNLVLNREAPGLYARSLERRVDHRHTSRALGARHACGGICQRSVQQSYGIHKRRISDRDVVVERYAAVPNTVSAANRSLAVPERIPGETDERREIALPGFKEASRNAILSRQDDAVVQVGRLAAGCNYLAGAIGHESAILIDGRGLRRIKTTGVKAAHAVPVHCVRRDIDIAQSQIDCKTRRNLPIIPELRYELPGM